MSYSSNSLNIHQFIFRVIMPEELFSQAWCKKPERLAGIRQHYTPEQLVGKLIVIVNNLAPVMLRGETSNGMLLAATSGEKVIVLTPDDPDCVPGAKVK